MQSFIKWSTTSSAPNIGELYFPREIFIYLCQILLRTLCNMMAKYVILKKFLKKPSLQSSKLSYARTEFELQTRIIVHYLISQSLELNACHCILSEHDSPVIILKNFFIFFMILKSNSLIFLNYPARSFFAGWHQPGIKSRFSVSLSEHWR